jgi:hypothetical protein
MLPILLSKATTAIFLVTVIFNAGGIVYLVLNHMPHANQRLARLEKSFVKLDRNVAWIRGRMSASEKGRK